MAIGYVVAYNAENARVGGEKRWGVDQSGTGYLVSQSRRTQMRTKPPDFSRKVW